MFSVVWSSTAQSDFTVIAFSNFDRSMEIDEAGDDIEDQLRSDPAGNGKHISEGLWRIESGPLAAMYSMVGNEVVMESVRWIG